MDVDEHVEVDVEESNLYENVLADSGFPDDPDQTMNSDEENLLDNNSEVIRAGENNSLLTENYESRNPFNEEHNIPCSSTVNESNFPICDNEMIAMEHEISENDIENFQDREYSHIEDVEMEPSNASMKSVDDSSVSVGFEVKQCTSENIENTNSVCLNEESNISMISQTERGTLNTDGSDQDLIDDQDERIHAEDNLSSIYDDNKAQPASAIEESMDEIHHEAEDSINFSSHCDTKVDKTNVALDENFKLDGENNVLISIKTNHAENLNEVINESEIQNSELAKNLYQQNDNEENEEKSSTNDEVTSCKGGESSRVQSTSTTLASTGENNISIIEKSKTEDYSDNLRDVNEKVNNPIEVLSVEKSIVSETRIGTLINDAKRCDDDQLLIDNDRNNMTGNSNDFYEIVEKENICNISKESIDKTVTESELQFPKHSKDLDQNINCKDDAKLHANKEPDEEKDFKLKAPLRDLICSSDIRNRTPYENSVEAINENEATDSINNLQAEGNDKSFKYEKILPVSLIPVTYQTDSDEHHTTLNDVEGNNFNDKFDCDEEKIKNKCSGTVIDLCNDDESVVAEQDEHGFKDSESLILQITTHERRSDTDIDHSDDEVKMNKDKKEVDSNNSLSEANDHCIYLTAKEDSEKIHKINLSEGITLDQNVTILSEEKKNNSEKLENCEIENSQESSMTIDQTEIENSDHSSIFSENNSKQNVNTLDNDKLDDNENSNVHLKESLITDSYKNNKKLCIDVTHEECNKKLCIDVTHEECKDQLNIKTSSGETEVKQIQQESENTENKMSHEKGQFQTDLCQDNDSDSNSDGNSDAYIDVSKFLISLNNKKENDHDKKVHYYDDDKSIEWNTDSGEHMEGRESVENSVSNIEEDRPQSESRNFEIVDTIDNMITDNVYKSNNEADKPVENINKDESTKDDKVDAEIVHTSEEILKGKECVEKYRLEPSLTTKKEDSLDADVLKGVKENKTDKINQHVKSLSSFKFIDNAAEEELTNNKNDKKPITAITTDGLAKSSSKITPFFEIPGEDIEDGIFTRVVIIGDYFISSYSKAWPMDLKFKPYFLYKEKISTDSLYSKICDHPYLKNSKNILVLFMLGVHDMAKYSTFKALTCRSSHSKLKIVREINYRPHSCFKYISEMLTLKKKLETEKALSCIFCYLPLVNFRAGLEDACALSRQKSKSCLCLPFIMKESVKKVFAENGLLNMNRKIFYKNLNETKERGVFEFLPQEVAFQEGAWVLTKERKSEENVKLFRLLLNKYLFCKEADDENSAFIKKELSIIKNQLIGHNPFKILIIGDTWIKCVAEEYDIHKKIQPYFYCKDGLTLNDIENLILSISDSDNILVISTIPYGEFFNISHLSECKDHTPLQYPVPVNDLLDDPLKYADHISKKIELFFINIKEKREKCKVVFLTCYPVSFNTCYKYLLDAHIASNSSHVSTETLIDKHNLSDFDVKVEKCFRKLNKKIVNINKENNLLTCNIFSLVAKLSSKEMFLFPIYIPHKCPPQSIEEKLQELFYQYVKNLYNLLIDTNYFFEDKKTINKQDFSPSQKQDLLSMKKLNTNKHTSPSDDQRQKMSAVHFPEKFHAKEVAQYPDKFNKMENSSAKKSSKYKDYSTSRSTKYGNEAIHAESRYPIKSVSEQPKEENKDYSTSRSTSKYGNETIHAESRYPIKSVYEQPKEEYKDYSISRSKYAKETVHAESRYPIKSVSEQPNEEYNIHNFNYNKLDYRDHYFPDDNRRSPHKSFYGYRDSPHSSDRRFSEKKSKERRRSGSKNTTRKRSRSGDRRRSRSGDRRRSRSRNRRSRSKDANRYISGRRNWSRSRSKSNSRSEWRASATKPDRVKRSTKKRRSRSPTPKDLILNEHCTSTEKTAIVSLWNIHLKECEMYRKCPDAHPDHDRVKRKWLDVMTSQGLNTSDPSILEHWREYWTKKMGNFFQDSWEEKKEKCLDVLSSKSRLKDSSDSRSSSADSSSDSLSDSKRSRKSKHKRKSKKKSRKKSKKDSLKDKRQSSKGKAQSIDLSLKPAEKLLSRVNEFMMNSQDSKMAPPAIQPQPVAPPNQKLFKPIPSASTDKDRENLLEITSILCQISDRFGALGKSLTTLHDEAVKCFQNKLNPLDCIDEDAKMLLDLIGDKIKKILDSSDLNVVQRAIIQEAHDRLIPFLESYDKKKVSPVNLDINYLAAATLGMQVSEIIGFVREHFIYRGHKNVTNEELMGVYLEIKSHQIKLVNQNNDMISQARHKPQSLSSSTVNLISGYPHLQGIPSTSNINQMISMRGVRIREEFLALSLQEKIKKFAQFHTLPFEEKSFLLSHLDELEKTDKNLTESLRVMILRSKPT